MTLESFWHDKVVDSEGQVVDWSTDQDSSGQKIPLTDGIPWLFRDTEATLWQWRQNIRLNFQVLLKEIQALKDEDNQCPDQTTRKRIARILQAKIEHIKLLRQILDPLEPARDDDIEVLRVLGAKLPLTQSISSYYENIHRDWGWDEDVAEQENENTLSMGEILRNAGETQASSMVVLGSGGARLAYDLHRHWGIENTLNIDINPLLFLIAKKVSSGKSAKLYEFPITPRDRDSVAVLRKLKAPQPLKSGFSFLFADAMDPPLAPASCELVVTPWLLDIVSQSVSDFAAKINRILKPGGIWINFGSTAFISGPYAERYTHEDLLDVVGTLGFNIKSHSHEVIPYMCSPISCHGRRERVLTFVAEKTSEASEKEAFFHLPEWLRNFDLAIPRLPVIQQRLQAHTLYGAILGCVDGARSVQAVADQVAQNYGMSPEEARSSVARFFASVYEESR